MRHRLLPTRLALWHIHAALIAVAISLSACGGGDGPGSAGGPTPSGGDLPSGGSGSTGTGSIRVKVTDALGESVAGASVWVSATDTSSLTGPDGTVQFDDVPAGSSRVCAIHPVRGHTCSAPDPVMVENGKLLELSRRLEQVPWIDGVAATVLSATVEPGGVSPDGRTLDVTLRTLVVGPEYKGSWFVDGNDWGYNRVQVYDCTARTDDELAELGPRCIRGVDGSDASYSFRQVINPGAVKTIRGPAVPWAVGLLIEQSDSGLSPHWRPNDPRLFVAKLFSDWLLPGTPLLLAAFASDEPSGVASNLPQRPVTFFPVESPAFLTNRRQGIAVLNDLSGQVGGGAPLYQAIASGIEFMAAHAPAGRQRALVVLADGADTTCGTPAQCAALRREIITRASDAAVQLFIVGGPSNDCTPDWCVTDPSDTQPLQLLAREGGFPIVVAAQPALIAPMQLVRQWISGEMMVQDVSLRLTSETAGAFAPGATVMGKLTGANASQCPMGCEVHELIFSVEIAR